MNGSLRRLMLLVTIDVRRPAGWLAIAVALGTAATLPDASPVGWPAPEVVATLLGATVAVMTIGDAAHLCGPAGIDVGWLAVRVAWPLLGWGLATGLRGDGPLCVCGGLGILSATILVSMFVRRGALVADAASATIVAAGASAATGWWADSLWPGRLVGGAVAAAFFALVALVATAMPGPTPVLRAGLRRMLTVAAMIGAVAGMAGWLFLAEAHAGLDFASSLAWFTALAVPAATLGDGVSHAASWRRLERSAPRACGRWPRLGPGRTRDRVLAALGNAAILGWPPCVAASLSGGDAARAWTAAALVASLAAAAGLLLAVSWLGEIAALSPETEQAVAFAVGAAVMVTAVAIAVAGDPASLIAPISA